MDASSDPVTAGRRAQVDTVFQLASRKGYLNLKGYGDFAAQNRASGWNIWLTFSVSQPAPNSRSLARSDVA